MPGDADGIVDTVTDISNDHRITQDRISDLIQDLGFNPDNAEFNVVMEDMVPPTSGEAMMEKRAEAHERSLVIDALVQETLSYPPVAIYSPKEADRERMAIMPGEEADEIGRESSSKLWLHTASEVSKAESTVLVSPVIISVSDSDDVTQHFHTHSFDKKDAQELIELIHDKT
ncbi:hypothetical protein [Haloarchaeobius amylolyticus]|uniref:hypothetical protein n=1 Tax=Haloarchaeobius amylolyticus TaxID=1198296 RepID=UPI00227229BD|nr:hypothetical protein [Haloarchaeobius amylolyticus]